MLSSAVGCLSQMACAHYVSLRSNVRCEVGIGRDSALSEMESMTNKAVAGDGKGDHRPLLQTWILGFNGALFSGHMADASTPNWNKRQ